MSGDMGASLKHYSNQLRSAASESHPASSASSLSLDGIADIRVFVGSVPAETNPTMWQ